MALHVRRTAAIVAVALVAAACGGSGDDEVSTRNSSTSSSTPTSTTDGGSSTGSGEPDAAPSGAADPGEASDQADAGGSAAGSSGTPRHDDLPPPAPSDPAATQPTRPGTYTYDTDGEATGPTGTAKLPERTTLEVKKANGSRQRQIRKIQEPDGDGSVSTIDLQFRDDGVYLEFLQIRTDTGLGTVTFEFDFDPPELILPTGVAVGFSTKFSTESTDGSIEADVTVKVSGKKRLTVGGTGVDTLTVDTVITFGGAFDGKSVWKDSLDPERYLIVREDRKSHADAGIGSFHSDYVATLRSLSPS